MATTQTTTTNVPAPSAIAPFPQGTTQITQAPLNTRPIRPPEVVQRLTFSSETIKRLTADDFDLGSKELITLKYDDCILVLFYVENTESQEIVTIWALVAQQVAGPVFAGINMLSERKVAEAFTRLKSDGSHPLHWAALRQYPYILVYRKRWPVAVYNGAREVQALIDYALTRACEAGYYEPIQLDGSMQAEARIGMGPVDPYTNIPGSPPRIRTESLQYNAEEPIRGFNPNIPVVITGSTGSRIATGEIRSEETTEQREEAAGISPSLAQNLEDLPATNPITGEQNFPAPSVSPPPPVTNPSVPQPITPITQGGPAVTTNIATPANTQ
ncbi:Hypothetical protein HVR_LOCUS1336 [uncultured virus]|nr:Hypothetical protein HVR_LOCUS1336 [uncultured virus]